MTITTVDIVCDVGLPDNTEFPASRIDFRLSGPDYDTVSNDVIPAVTVSAILDGSGTETVGLWPVDRGIRNTFYSVILQASLVVNGRTIAETFTLGRIAPPSDEASYGLADLLAQSTGGITVGSQIYATLADAVAAALEAAAAGADPIAAIAARDAAVVAQGLAEDAAEDADAEATLAEEARLAAEAARDASFTNATVYPDIATGRAAVADGEQFTVVVPGATEAVRYERDSSSTQTELARFPTSALVTGPTGENLLFDPYGETVDALSRADPYVGYGLAEADTFQNPSPNSPFGTRSIGRASGTGSLRRRLSLNALGIEPSTDLVRVRVMAYLAAGSSTVTVFTRTAAAGVVASQAFSGLGPGLVDVTCDRLSCVGAVEIMIDVSGSAAREIIAVGVTTGAGVPAISPLIPQSALRLRRNVANLHPDPFWRRYDLGETVIDGYAPISEASGWSVVDFASSPFARKRALLAAAGSGPLNRRVDTARLGLRVDGTVTVRLGIHFPTTGTFQLGTYFRTAANAVTGPATSTTFVIPSVGYHELVVRLPISQTIFDNAVALELRMNVAGVNWTSGYYLCASGLFADEFDPALVDDAADADAILQRVRVLENASAGARPASFGLERLRETRQRLRSLRSGKTGTTARLTIAMIGDSWTHNNQRYPLKVARALWPKYHAGNARVDDGPIGRGWIGFGSGAGGTLSNGDVRRTDRVTILSGTWDFSGYGTGGGPDVCQAVGPTGGLLRFIDNQSYTIQTQFDLFAAGGAGVIRHSWDGGATWQANTDLSALASGLQVVTLGGKPTSGSGVFQLEVVTGPATLYGINEWLPGTAGVLIHKLGATGSRAQQWAAVDATRWQAGFTALAPDLVTICHGTNDQGSARTKAQYKADVQTIISRARSARPACDILLIAPAENQRTDNAIAMSEYAQALYEISQEQDVAYLDLQPTFGVLPADYASGSDRPWFNADLIHPEPELGGFAIADVYLSAVGEVSA